MSQVFIEPSPQPLNFFDRDNRGRLAARPRIIARPVDPDWHCQRSGDCCRMVEAVVMTDAEAHVFQEAADRRFSIARLNRMQWSVERPGFKQLRAAPCPALEGGNVCLLHDVRPYNCRRFGCLRPDVKAEPLVMAPASSYLRFGQIGCSNLRERLVNSRVARRVYARLQRKAQRWALSHGWSQHAE